MATLLKPGQTLRSVGSGADARVESLLGEGGQGEVHRVTLGTERYAVKWYNDLVLDLDRGLRRRLGVAIDRGAPSGRFLWPFELVTLPDGSRLGYLMRLRKQGFHKLHSLLGRREDDTSTNAAASGASLRVLATMCCLLTDALLALHAQGLAYQDLNAGSVFFDPSTGDIEICDNDNVDVDGAPSIMAGQREYQAPEIVLRQAGPSRATDLHSLAVLLFRILHKGHPLIGKRELDHPNLATDSVTRRLYGTEARFVFDPADESNRPLPDLHRPVLAHWDIYPQSIRDLFTRAFTEGLYDPMHGRVQESDWRRALSGLRDAVVTCRRCSAENFYEPRRVSGKQATFPCWCCDAALASAPPRLGIRRAGARPGEAPLHIVILEPGARLFAHHTAGAAEYDFSAPTGEVHGGEPLGLRNLSRRPWVATLGAAEATVAPGESVPLAAGVRVRFERAEGEAKL